MTAKEQRIRELRGGSPDQSRQPEDLFLKDRPNSFPIARLNTSKKQRGTDRDRAAIPVLGWGHTGMMPHLATGWKPLGPTGKMPVLL
jgi:hypothetical protein